MEGERMKRNQWYYYKTGTRLARRVLLKDSLLFLKYTIYLAATLIGKIVFVLQPIFTLGHERLAHEVMEKEQFKLESIFDDANSSRKYWLSLMMYLIQLGLLAAGLAVIYLFTQAGYFLGRALDEITDLSFSIFKFLFLVPGLVVGLYYTFYLLSKFAPTSVLIKEEVAAGIGEIIQLNFRLMDQDRMKRWREILVINLVKVGFWAGFGLILLWFTHKQFDRIVFYVTMILYLLFFLRIAVEKALSIKLAVVLLMEDALKGMDQIGINEEESDAFEQQLIALFEQLPDQGGDAS